MGRFVSQGSDVVVKSGDSKWRNRVVYDVPGTYTFDVPENVDEIKAVVVSGGQVGTLCATCEELCYVVEIGDCVCIKHCNNSRIYMPHAEAVGGTGHQCFWCVTKNSCCICKYCCCTTTYCYNAVDCPCCNCEYWEACLKFLKPVCFNHQKAEHKFGGASGSYIEACYAVTPGESFDIAVGAPNGTSCVSCLAIASPPQLDPTYNAGDCETCTYFDPACFITIIDTCPEVCTLESCCAMPCDICCDLCVCCCLSGCQCYNCCIRRRECYCSHTCCGCYNLGTVLQGTELLNRHVIKGNAAVCPFKVATTTTCNAINPIVRDGGKPRHSYNCCVYTAGIGATYDCLIESNSAKWSYTENNCCAITCIGYSECCWCCYCDACMCNCYNCTVWTPCLKVGCECLGGTFSTCICTFDTCAGAVLRRYSQSAFYYNGNSVPVLSENDTLPCNTNSCANCTCCFTVFCEVFCGNYQSSIACTDPALCFNMRMCEEDYKIYCCQVSQSCIFPGISIGCKTGYIGMCNETCCIQVGPAGSSVCAQSNCMCATSLREVANNSCQYTYSVRGAGADEQCNTVDYVYSTVGDTNPGFSNVNKMCMADPIANNPDWWEPSDICGLGGASYIKLPGLCLPETPAGPGAGSAGTLPSGIFAGAGSHSLPGPGGGWGAGCTCTAETSCIGGVVIIYW